MDQKPRSHLILKRLAVLEKLYPQKYRQLKLLQHQCLNDQYCNYAGPLIEYYNGDFIQGNQHWMSIRCPKCFHLQSWGKIDLLGDLLTLHVREALITKIYIGDAPDH